MLDNVELLKKYNEYKESCHEIDLDKFEVNQMNISDELKAKFTNFDKPYFIIFKREVEQDGEKKTEAFVLAFLPKKEKPNEVDTYFVDPNSSYLNMAANEGKLGLCQNFIRGVRGLDGVVKEFSNPQNVSENQSELNQYYVCLANIEKIRTDWKSDKPQIGKNWVYNFFLHKNELGEKLRVWNDVQIKGAQAKVEEEKKAKEAEIAKSKYKPQKGNFTGKQLDDLIKMELPAVQSRVNYCEADKNGNWGDVSQFVDVDAGTSTGNAVMSKEDMEKALYFIIRNDKGDALLAFVPDEFGYVTFYINPKGNKSSNTELFAQAEELFNKITPYLTKPGKNVEPIKEISRDQNCRNEDEGLACIMNIKKMEILSSDPDLLPSAKFLDSPEEMKVSVGRLRNRIVELGIATKDEAALPNIELAAEKAAVERAKAEEQRAAAEKAAAEKAKAEKLMLAAKMVVAKDLKDPVRIRLRKNYLEAREKYFEKRKELDARLREVGGKVGKLDDSIVKAYIEVSQAFSDAGKALFSSGQAGFYTQGEHQEFRDIIKRLKAFMKLRERLTNVAETPGIDNYKKFLNSQMNLHDELLRQKSGTTSQPTNIASEASDKAAQERAAAERAAAERAAQERAAQERAAQARLAITASAISTPAANVQKDWIAWYTDIQELSIENFNRQMEFSQVYAELQMHGRNVSNQLFERPFIYKIKADGGEVFLAFVPTADGKTLNTYYVGTDAINAEKPMFESAKEYVKGLRGEFATNNKINERESDQTISDLVEFGKARLNSILGNWEEEKKKIATPAKATVEFVPPPPVNAPPPPAYAQPIWDLDEELTTDQIMNGVRASHPGRVFQFTNPIELAGGESLNLKALFPAAPGEESFMLNEDGNLAVNTNDEDEIIDLTIPIFVPMNIDGHHVLVTLVPKDNHQLEAYFSDSLGPVKDRKGQERRFKIASDIINELRRHPEYTNGFQVQELQDISVEKQYAQACGLAVISDIEDIVNAHINKSPLTLYSDNMEGRKSTFQRMGDDLVARGALPTKEQIAKDKADAAKAAAARIVKLKKEFDDAKAALIAERIVFRSKAEQARYRAVNLEFDVLDAYLKAGNELKKKAKALAAAGNKEVENDSELKRFIAYEERLRTTIAAKQAARASGVQATTEPSIQLTEAQNKIFNDLRLKLEKGISLEEFKKILSDDKTGFDIATVKKSDGMSDHNSLLISALIGGNIEIFKWLVEEKKLSIAEGISGLNGKFNQAAPEKKEAVAQNAREILHYIESKIDTATKSKINLIMLSAYYMEEDLFNKLQRDPNIDVNVKGTRNNRAVTIPLSNGDEISQRMAKKLLEDPRTEVGGLGILAVLINNQKYSLGLEFLRKNSVKLELDEFTKLDLGGADNSALKVLIMFTSSEVSEDFNAQAVLFCSILAHSMMNTEELDKKLNYDLKNNPKFANHHLGVVAAGYVKLSEDEKIRTRDLARTNGEEFQEWVKIVSDPELLQAFVSKMYGSPDVRSQFQSLKKNGMFFPYNIIESEYQKLVQFNVQVDLYCSNLAYSMMNVEELRVQLENNPKFKDHHSSVVAEGYKALNKGEKLRTYELGRANDQVFQGLIKIVSNSDMLQAFVSKMYDSSDVRSQFRSLVKNGMFFPYNIIESEYQKLVVSKGIFARIAAAFRDFTTSPRNGEMPKIFYQMAEARLNESKAKPPVGAVAPAVVPEPKKLTADERKAKIKLDLKANSVKQIRFNSQAEIDNRLQILEQIQGHYEGILVANKNDNKAKTFMTTARLLRKNLQVGKVYKYVVDDFIGKAGFKESLIEVQKSQDPRKGDQKKLASHSKRKSQGVGGGGGRTAG